MFCSKCGAAVTGNYCCVCGEKLRDPLAEFRLSERRRKAAFKGAAGGRTNLPLCHVAEACWDAASLKYRLLHACDARGVLYPDSWSRLQKSEDCARRLFNELAALLDRE